MNRRLIVAAALGLPILLAGLLLLARPEPTPLPVYWPVPPFHLLTQDSTPFRSEDLNGRVWVASFVYTNCPDFCPLVTRRMAALRDSLAAHDQLGEEVRLFSITVDPARDTPAVLRAHAKTVAAQAPDWVFLTGTPEVIIPLVNQGFRVTLIDNAADAHGSHAEGADNYMVSHSDRLVLIDRNAQVRGTYPATDPEAMRLLRRDVQRLLRER